MKSKKDKLMKELEKYENYKFLNQDSEVHEKIEKAKEEFFKIAHNLLNTNQMIRDTYFEVLKFEFQDKDMQKLKNETDEILLEMATKLEETVFFVSTPNNIGYTSSYHNIFLKYNYILYEKQENYKEFLKASLVLSFLHELINYIRRKLFERGEQIMINTPKLTEFPNNLKELSIDESKKQIFLQGEAGIRVEFLLFGDFMRYIFESEIDFFVNFLLKNPQISFLEFRKIFIANRQEAINKNESSLTYKQVNVNGSMEIGMCALASLRGLSHYY